jgi:glucose-6-phosphate 1-epimerase
MSQPSSPLESRLASAAFTRRVQRKALNCVEIRHPAFAADILLQGAQLLSFQPDGDDNWLWLSAEADYVTGVSVRGGIPLCWPWFGNADKNPPEVQSLMSSNSRLPAHGFARTSVWTISDLYEAADRVELEMSLKPGHNEQNLWHGQAEARVRWVFRKTGMTMSLTTRNTGNTPMAFSQALHTYLPTADIHNTRLDGLNQSSYLDTLSGWRRKTQAGAVVFQSETDRIYFHNEQQPLRLHTPQYSRVLRSQNSKSCIVWNPWIKKAQRLGQFQADAWQQMLCIETANAADDWVNLPAGAEHCLLLELSRY